MQNHPQGICLMLNCQQYRETDMYISVSSTTYSQATTEKLLAEKTSPQLIPITESNTPNNLQLKKLLKN